ncbi:MAG TPA: hypothetical protein VHO69_08205 [Phototrophicaceae bacterium]|nr:hypothetical protein [Phototrophicaceae bacterium]
MSDQQISRDEKFLANAVHYLLSKGQSDFARLLLTCELVVSAEHYSHPDDQDGDYDFTGVFLRGSPEFYDKYTNDLNDIYPPDSDAYTRPSQEDGAFRSAIRTAFRAVLGEEYFEIRVAVGLIEIDLDWRTRLFVENETQEQVGNQNSYAKTPLVWSGMRFNSKGEIAIAQALERLGVMYFPNCLARVGSRDNRQTRFPDFLVCYRGKWGILEIDGATYHTPSSATDDHERRRQIEQHGGISYFDRFKHSRCVNEPDKVVKEFLDILATK